ncbi:MAG: YraN family protein [Gammaproteobacteria bacterium]|nr:YraN family protein [Gammaproteobacteria bacterium]
MSLPSINNSTTKGQLAEQLACNYLQHQGLTLLDKNYHCRQGEIDLIMQDKTTLVFVEVRFRKNNLFGGASASVTQKKQHKLHTTALDYLQKHGKNSNARFDVIAITGDIKVEHIEWIKNAF